MNIAIIRSDTTEIQPDSYNSQELGLAKALSDLKHNVIIFSASVTENLHKTTNIPTNEGSGTITIELLPYSALPAIDYLLYKKIRASIQKHQIDLLHINEENNPVTAQLAWLSYRLKIPFVLYHGMYEVPSGKARQAYELAHRMLFRPFIRKLCIQVFCKTTSARDFMVHRGYPNAKVLPVGLDTSAFSQPAYSDWKQALEIPEISSVVLYIGKLEKRRNTVFLVKLAKALEDRNVHFIIAGDGPEKNAAESYARENEVSNVSFPGKLSQDQLPDLYRVSDIFVLPSNYEIFGMVLLEALYFGIPSITTKTAGARDIVNDEKTGRLMDNIDVASWADEITDMLNSNNKDITRQHCKGVFQKNYQWSILASHYMNTLEKSAMESTNV